MSVTVARVLRRVRDRPDQPAPMTTGIPTSIPVLVPLSSVIVRSKLPGGTADHLRDTPVTSSMLGRSSSLLELGDVLADGALRG